jgi:DNA invertase Pin-like site-specific DNA recombinase
MAGAGKPGQRGYVVTDHNRKLVHALAATGRSQDEIARHIGCSDVTLRRYYRDELNTAATEATRHPAVPAAALATPAAR